MVKLQMPSIGIPSSRIVVSVAVLMALILVVIYFLGSMQTGTVAARFSSQRIKAGEETRLVLELRNTLEKDVKYLSVAVMPVDPNTITISENVMEQRQANFGVGERRVLRFDVFTNANALEGSYTVIVKTIMDIDGENLAFPDLEETRRIQLELTR